MATAIECCSITWFCILRTAYDDQRDSSVVLRVKLYDFHNLSLLISYYLSSLLLPECDIIIGIMLAVFLLSLSIVIMVYRLVVLSAFDQADATSISLVNDRWLSSFFIFEHEKVVIDIVQGEDGFLD